MRATDHAQKSRSSLQFYLLLIAAVASLVLLSKTSGALRQAGSIHAPGQGRATGYGYSGKQPATLQNHLEAIRLAALDPYREHRR